MADLSSEFFFAASLKEIVPPKISVLIDKAFSLANSTS
jgi:hypothetical protein